MESDNLKIKGFKNVESKVPGFNKYFQNSTAHSDPEVKRKCQDLTSICKTAQLTVIQKLKESARI